MIGDSECVTIEQSGFGACTVLCSNYNQIVCDTKPHAETAEGSIVKVTVDIIYPVQQNNGVKFQWVDGAAGRLNSVYPKSAKAGTVLNLKGAGWSNMQETGSGNGKIGDFLNSFNSVLIGSGISRVGGGQDCTQPESSGHSSAGQCRDTPGAVCDASSTGLGGVNFNRPRYLARPEDYDSSNAFTTLYKPDHYRCKLPIYAAGSYTARVTTGKVYFFN